MFAIIAILEIQKSAIMWKLFFVFVSICFCSQSFSQGVPEAEINFKRLNKMMGKEDIVSMPGTDVNLQPLLAPKRQTLAPVFVGSNSRGDIYELPQDNMPMLKPHLQQENVMPGTGLRKQPDEADLQGKIPNAIIPKVYKFVPDNQPLKK
jgi:hypothetical protein